MRDAPDVLLGFEDEVLVGLQEDRLHLRRLPQLQGQPRPEPLQGAGPTGSGGPDDDPLDHLPFAHSPQSPKARLGTWPVSLQHEAC